jgi:predicted murein hydrolase (TIGR00659 family)
MTHVMELGTAFLQLPLSGVFLTLGAYELAAAASIWLGSPAWANPVLLAIAFLGGVLALSGLSYQTYFDSAKFIHWLLGPAVVALAIPLHKNLRAIKQSSVAIAAALVAGGTLAAVSAVAIAWLLGAPSEVMLSLAPKSVTTAIAIGISGQIGGIPELTAVVVIITGILGAVLTVPLLRITRVECPRALGLAAGVAGHGIATAQVLMVNETAGAFAGLAMGLCGIGTATLMPAAVSLLAH